MTHFIKLKEAWNFSEKGDVVEVGKSTAHGLIQSGKGVRTPDPSRFPPVAMTKAKKVKKKIKSLKKKLWGI